MFSIKKKHIYCIFQRNRLFYSYFQTLFEATVLWNINHKAFVEFLAAKLQAGFL